MRAIELVEGDELISVSLTDGGRDIIVATKNGMSIRFEERCGRTMGRTTRGVKAIDLNAGDEVVSAVVVNETETILAVSENGYGKRTDVG